MEILDGLTIDENLWTINFRIKFNFKFRDSYDLQKFLDALIENLDTGTGRQAFNSGFETVKGPAKDEGPSPWTTAFPVVTTSPKLVMVGILY